MKVRFALVSFCFQELPTDSSLPTKPCVPEDVKEQKVGAASPSDATLESPSKRQHIEVGSVRFNIIYHDTETSRY